MKRRAVWVARVVGVVVAAAVAPRAATAEYGPDTLVAGRLAGIERLELLSPSGDDVTAAASERNVDGCNTSTHRLPAPLVGRWREFTVYEGEWFVFSNGRTAEYDWAVDGQDILIRRLDAQDGALFRLRLTRIGDDSDEAWEGRSQDGGTSWVRGEVTVTRRVGRCHQTRC